MYRELTDYLQVILEWQKHYLIVNTIVITYYITGLQDIVFYTLHFYAGNSQEIL